MEWSNVPECLKNLVFKNTEADYYRNPAQVSSEILRAVFAEDLTRLTNLVDSGESLNAFDCFGNGPFHIATFKANSKIVDYLLTKRGLIDARNHKGETPLIKSIHYRKYDLAKKLICAGADVNIPNDSHVTALHYAIAVPELAHILIEHGANVDAVDLVNQTPLHLAVHRGCLESVYMLLYYNADANCRDLEDYTPFMIALKGDNIRMLEVLIEYVVDFNDTRKDGSNILSLALAEGSPFVTEIINRGADVSKVKRDENWEFYRSVRYCKHVSQELYIKIFKSIWDKMEYRFSKRMSILGDLFQIEACHYEHVLDTIVESANFSQAVESVCYFDDMHFFISKCAEVNLPLEKFTKIFCMFLTHGYTPSDSDMIAIFSYYGYCELYRMLLYMDIRILRGSNLRYHFLCNIPTRLMYEVRYDLYAQLDDVVYFVKNHIFPFDDSFAILRLLDYCVYPELTNAYLNLNRSDCVTLKIKALPRVPSLVELARNATRGHIIRTFSVTSSCKLYSLIDTLYIPQVIKKILTFETVLYRPTYIADEFENFIKMLEKYPIKYITDPLIQSARINANII